MEQSWPYVLAQLTGQRVYNMGMGGYGPNQYFYLLKNRALSLKPRMVICGLYMGDDFENAYSITYGLDYWASLRNLQVQKAQYEIWDTISARVSWNKSVRVWFSQHSVVYQVVFHGPLMGRLQGEFQIKNAAELYPGIATALYIPEKHILEAFRPGSLDAARSAEPRSPGRDAHYLRIAERNEGSLRSAQIQFVVVVIPTKEQVFSEYLEHNPRLPLHDTVDELIANERVARAKTFHALTDAGIQYVDVLPALKSSLATQLYARTAADMHPGKNGYRVIAEEVSRELQR